jgi:hypothetical protein
MATRKQLFCFVVVNFEADPLIIAVIASDCVLLYDTKDLDVPLAVAKGLHLAPHSDACWSVVSSGF